VYDASTRRSLPLLCQGREGDKSQEMNNHIDDIDEFPTHTADTIEVLSGNTRPSQEVSITAEITVWVQTLNSHHRSEAELAASIFAAREAYMYRKGSELYDVFIANFEMQSAEQQADYLANHELDSGRISVDAVLKYPMPLRPEQGTMTAEEWTRAVAKYDKDYEKSSKQREEYVAKRMAEIKKTSLELTEKVRLERCMKAFVEVRYNTSVAKRMTHEVLLRAVRHNDNRGKMYYTNVEQVEDLDDEIKQKLIIKYQECDTVTSEQVPT
jgi:hypothetical protein